MLNGEGVDYVDPKEKTTNELQSKEWWFDVCGPPDAGMLDLWGYFHPKYPYLFPHLFSDSCLEGNDFAQVN